MDSQHIRVIVADDHPVIRMGIELELDRVPGMRVVGSARDSTELVALLAEPCDVLVTDYAMPGGEHGDGLALLAYIAAQFPALPIVVVTAIDKPALVRTLLSRGIVDIVSKADAMTHIVPAVQAAFVRRRYHSPTIAAIVASLAGADPLAKLSPREAEVMALFVAGLSISDIADRLQRSKQTVSTQKVNAMAKLGVDNEAELFAYVAETGMFG